MGLPGGVFPASDIEVETQRDETSGSNEEAKKERAIQKRGRRKEHARDIRPLIHSFIHSLLIAPLTVCRALF